MLFIPPKTWLAGTSNGVCQHHRYTSIWRRSHIIKIIVWIQKREIKNKIIRTIVGDHREVKHKLCKMVFSFVLSFLEPQMVSPIPGCAHWRRLVSEGSTSVASLFSQVGIQAVWLFCLWMTHCVVSNPESNFFWYSPNSSTGKPSEKHYKNETFYEEHKDDPTIFVGAAHCNFICMDFTDPTHPMALETCCCLPPGLSTSCKKGSRVSSKLKKRDTMRCARL